MPGLKEEERARLKAKYKPVQRRLKASSRAFPLSKTLRMLSRGSNKQLDLNANRLAMAINAINELTTDLSTPTDGRYPELTPERLKALNERYAEAIKECDLLTNAEYLNDEDREKQKYQTYAEMASKIRSLLTLDYKYLETANAKLGQTLPEILSGARNVVLKKSQVNFDTVGAAQSARHPVTVTLPSGKKVKGMFTEKDDFNPGKDFNEVLDLLRVNPALNKIVDSLKLPANYENADGLYFRLSSAREAILDYFKIKNYRRLVEEGRAQGKTEQELRPSKEMQDILNRRSGNVGPADIIRYLDGGTTQSIKLKDGYAEAMDALKDPTLFEGMMSTFYNNSLKTFTRLEINAHNIGMTSGNLDTKNAASSVIASLLGRPDLLANGTPVKMEMPDGSVVEGTFTEFAEGLSIGNTGSDRGAYENQSYYDFHVSTGIDNKPVLKDIFDTEMMDYVLGNVDPHGNNLIYDVQEEAGTYVLKGLKRIDLDNTFCINPIGKLGTKNLAHVSRMHAISDSMAQRLECLTPEAIELALSGYKQSQKNPQGLSKAAIDAVWRRVEEIKEHIDHSLTSPKEGKLMVLKDEDWKKYKLHDLCVTAQKGAPNGTSLDIGAWFNEESKAAVSKEAAAREAMEAAAKKVKQVSFPEVKATFTAKNGKEISYTKMEKAIDKVVQGLDEVADVWFGSSQYKKMRTQAKTIQSMLHEYNAAPTDAPKDPEFKKNLDDELLKFMDKTEAYFVRKREQGQKAANNENSMKRIKAATDAADFAAKYVNKSEKKNAEKQNASGPAL